jgi:hypothetical protein
MPRAVGRGPRLDLGGARRRRPRKGRAVGIANIVVGVAHIGGIARVDRGQADHHTRGLCNGRLWRSLIIIVTSTAGTIPNIVIVATVAIIIIARRAPRALGLGRRRLRRFRGLGSAGIGLPVGGDGLGCRLGRTGLLRLCLGLSLGRNDPAVLTIVTVIICVCCDSAAQSGATRTIGIAIGGGFNNGFVGGPVVHGAIAVAIPRRSRR